MSTSPANPRTPRIPDFVLTSDELRAVTAFNLACAEQVIDLFEEVQPNDTRPKEALNAAAALAGGEPAPWHSASVRSRLTERRRRSDRLQCTRQWPRGTRQPRRIC